MRAKSHRTRCGFRGFRRSYKNIRGDVTALLWVGALSFQFGAFVERWLFFAEAKHLVMLYY